MAFRPLTGPQPITYETGGTAAAFTSTSQAVEDFFWYPGYGLVASVDNLLCGITLDGVASTIGFGIYWAAPYGYTQPLTAGMTFNPSDQKWYKTVSPSSTVVGSIYYELDRSSMIMVPTVIQRDYMINSPFILLPDRNIWFDSSSGVIKESHAAGVSSQEAAIGSALGYSAKPCLGPGRSSGEVFFSTSNGTMASRGFFYNWGLKKMVSPAYQFPTSSLAVVYCPGLDVFAVFSNSPGPCLQIFSTELMPAAISAPVLVGGLEKAGHIAYYQVQVTDQNSAPTPNEVIDWSLTGKGVILDGQSATNPSGNATTRVLYDLTDVGTTVLTATLVN